MFPVKSVKATGKHPDDEKKRQKINNTNVADNQNNFHFTFSLIFFNVSKMLAFFSYFFAFHRINFGFMQRLNMEQNRFLFCFCSRDTFYHNFLLFLWKLSKQRRKWKVNLLFALLTSCHTQFYISYISPLFFIHLLAFS